MGVLAPGSAHARPSAQPPIFKKKEKCLESPEIQIVWPAPPPRYVRRKFPLVSMGDWAEGLACADPGARTPIGARGIIYLFSMFHSTFGLI